MEVNYFRSQMNILTKQRASQRHGAGAVDGPVDDLVPDLPASVLTEQPLY